MNNRIETARTCCQLLLALAMTGLSSAGVASTEDWVDSDMNGLKESLLHVHGESYLVRDSRTGSPAVLLVHGMPDDGLVWKEQVPALLAAGYRVVVPDTLGNGSKSSRPDDHMRLDSALVAADMANVMEQLGIEKYHYIGHDEGAILGWEFAMTYADRLKSHIELSVGHPLAWAKTSFTLHGARMNWYSYLNSVPNGAEVWRAGNGRLLKLALKTHPDRDRVFEYMMKPGGTEWAWMFDTVNGVARFMINYANGIYDNLPKVTVPSLGILGTTDEAMWESQMADSVEFVDAEWKMELVEAGHWLQLEQPGKVNKLILDWLRAHP